MTDDGDLDYESARLKIHTAIEDYLRLGDVDGEGALDATNFVNQWAIVVNVPLLERNDYSNYWALYSEPGMPTHTAIGLFKVGMDLAARDYVEEG